MLGTISMFKSVALIFHVAVLVALCGSEKSRPDTDARMHLLVEAAKTAILNGLGMESEPRLMQKASEEQLRKMHQLYGDKLREMRGNSSLSSPSTMSTVLFPVTVETLKGHQRVAHPRPGPRARWYRAVFQKNPDIQAEVTLAWAELKISRRILNKPTSAQAKVKAKVRLMKSVRSAVKTRNEPLCRADDSNTEDVTFHISPQVAKWIRADAGESLVVDLKGDALGTKPAVSLELRFIHSEPAPKARLRRSNKEDDCKSQGWCCRKSVTVSFKDIGWGDWVVAPDKYRMHLCDGTCPHNYKPASMHTQVKSRLSQIVKGRTPRPCCVPAAYEPMVLMHYDSGGRLTLTPFSDLIVTKCHCA